MKTAIYPGSFDPITNGHIDVVGRAAEIFDRVIVTVARNSAKQPLFTIGERVAMATRVLKSFRNVRVDTFDGLVIDYARRIRATAIVRGLRAVSDFEFEFQVALMNRKLDDSVKTVFLMPHEKYTYLNSSVVKEIASYGGDVTEFVPGLVAKELARTFAGRRRGR
jgi:pantetheine-phosphate adenylyltransferase